MSQAPDSVVRPVTRPPSGRSGAVLGTLLALTLASAWVPSRAAAQAVGPLLEAIRQGGSWVNIPIENGKGSVETAEVPTFGLELAGCARIWSGHSGLWTIQAADLIADSTLTAVMEPDEPVRFRHRSGARAQLSLDIRWSEPRDTTLFLWVGLGGRERRNGDACVPPDPSSRP